MPRLPGVSQVVTDKRELPDLLGRFGVTDIPTGISGFGRRHRAYVKVQDGCMLRCSFCIIPHVRPHLASRPMEHILDEVRRLVDRGYREVVLTGIHLGHYGVDWNRSISRTCRSGCGFRDSDAASIAELPGDFRVRLSSIEATEVTRELIDVMAEHPDKVARTCTFRCRAAATACCDACVAVGAASGSSIAARLLQERLDRPAITTDIIVGFPGETDAEFEETIAVSREVGFSKIHIFPFSPRRGTPAGEMPNQVPKHVQQERSRELAIVEAELRDCILPKSLRATAARAARSEGRRMRRAADRDVDGHLVPLRNGGATRTADEGHFVDAIAADIRGERIVGN